MGTVPYWGLSRDHRCLTTVYLPESLSYVKNTIVFITWSRRSIEYGAFLQESGCGRNTKALGRWTKPKGDLMFAALKARASHCCACKAVRINGDKGAVRYPKLKR